MIPARQLPGLLKQGGLFCFFQMGVLDFLMILQ